MLKHLSTVMPELVAGMTWRGIPVTPSIHSKGGER